MAMRGVLGKNSPSEIIVVEDDATAGVDGTRSGGNGGEVPGEGNEEEAPRKRAAPLSPSAASATTPRGGEQGHSSHQQRGAASRFLEAGGRGRR